MGLQMSLLYVNFDFNCISSHGIHRFLALSEPLRMITIVLWQLLCPAHLLAMAVLFIDDNHFYCSKTESQLHFGLYLADG